MTDSAHIYFRGPGDKVALALILSLSLALGLWGNSWGAPGRWHPDELTNDAIRLVDGRTLDPNFFAYGGIQHYIVAAFGVLPVKAYSAVLDRAVDQPGTVPRLEWEDRQRTRMIEAARAISAVLATLVVAIVFVVGARLFGPGAGLIGALLLSIAMSWDQLAHFATVDVGATWWFWAASLCALLYWQEGATGWGLLGALLVGIAFGAKADRAVAAFPLLTAALLRNPRPRLLPAVLVGSAMVLFGYLLANPVLVLSPFKYLDGFTRDLFFNLHREPGEAGLRIIMRLSEAGLGRAAFAVVLAGGLYGIARLAMTRRLGPLLWLASTVLPSLLLFAGKKVMVWYVPTFFPAAMILAGYGCADFVGRLPRGAGLLAKCLGAVLLTRALWFTYTHIRLFREDTRSAAEQWILAHAKPGARVEIDGNGPVLPEGRYRVRKSFDGEFCEETTTTLATLGRDPRYAALRHWILASEGGVRRLVKLSPRKPYEGWFDQYVVTCAATARGLAARAEAPDSLPEYVVRVGAARSDDLGPGGPEGAGYTVAAQFAAPPGVDRSELIFLDPQVTVLQRPGGTPQN